MYSHKPYQKIDMVVFFMHLVVLLFCLYRVANHLGASLWLDEFTTYWVVEGGFKEVFERTYSYQGQNFLYFITVWLSINLFGSESELIVRLPTLIATIATLILTYKIARLFLDIQCSLITLTFLTCSAEFFTLSTTARPYTLPLALFLLGLLTLIHWISERRNIYLAILSLCAGGIFYSHYLLIPCISVYCILFLLTKFDRKELPIKPAIVAGISVILLCLPALPHLLLLSSKSELYQFASVPTISRLFESIFKPELTLIVSSFILSFLLNKIRGEQGLKVKSEPFFITGKVAVSTLLFWILAPSIILFLSWQVLGVNNFASRYLVWQKPGVALLGGMLACLLSSSKIVRFLYCSLTVILLSTYLRSNSENWRDAVKYIRAKPEKCHIFLYSGLIESKSIGWLENKKDYFLTPYRYYHKDMKEPVTPLPIFLFNKEQKDYVDTQIEKSFTEYKCVDLIARTILIDGKKSSGLFDERFEKAGAKLISSEDFGNVNISTWGSYVK